jgi:hypothetical protein
MDPEAFKNYRGFMVDLHRQAPVNDQAQKLFDESMTESSGQSGPVDTSWSVYSANVLRGSLEGEPNPNDPRMSVGWSANATAVNREKNLRPWMSTTEQQPLMADNGFWVWAPKDDETLVCFHSVNNSKIC